MKKLMVGVFAACGVSLAASAEEITVSSVAELRAAIADTAGVPNGSTIVLKASETHYDVSADGQGAIKISRELTLKGETDNPRDTVLSGGGVINVLEVSGANSFVTGLTVTNGLAQLTDSRGYYDGGGMFITSSSAVVSNCVATGCHFDMRTDYLDGLPTANINTARGIGVSIKAGLLVDSLIENCWIYNDRIAKGGANGAGLMVSSATARDCTIRNCAARTKSNGTGTSGLLAGGVVVGNEGVLLHSKVTGNVIEALDGGSRCYGAGLALSGNANTLVKDCLICNNTNLYSSGLGGGVAMVSGGVIRESTISNNYSYGRGGGFHVETSKSCLIYDCLIAENTAVSSGGGGYGFLYGAGNVISNNVAGTGSGTGGGWYQGAGFAAISNTLFIANQGDPSAYRMQNTAGNPILVSGCWFVRNKAGKTVFHFAGTGNRNLSLRNSFFYDNQGQSLNVQGQNNATEIATNWIDNCTFYEPNYSGSFAWDNADASKASGNTNNWFRNCLFYGKGSYAGVPRPICYGWANQISNNYDKAGTYLPKDGEGNPINGNLDLAHGGEPGFLDAAAGDCRPGRKSLIRGAGRLLEWMCDADGKPDPRVVDAGSGSYQIRKVGDYGVCFDVGKRNPRVEKGSLTPSIGCFEYYAIPGLLLMVR